ADLRAAMSTFKPHVYMQESADVPEDRRLGWTRERNRALKRARKHPAERARMLADAARGKLAHLEQAYAVEEQRILLDANGVRFYAVEGYSKGELAALDRAMYAGMEGRALTAHLERGRFEEALEDHRRRLFAFAMDFVAVRNERIVRGFASMSDELCMLFEH